jgi:glycerol transport system permease protein
MARSLGFTALVLAVEVPLGIRIALRMAPKGLAASAPLVVFALPLMMPVMVVGYLWKVIVLVGVRGTGVISSPLAA